jgi:hypothetical protein
MADERVSHEKREGNCRIVYFESPTLWNHEDCPICRAERAERELKEVKKALVWLWNNSVSMVNLFSFDNKKANWIANLVNAARAAAKENS